MVFVTSPVPQIGAPVAAEQRRISALLTEMVNLINGGLESDNLSLLLRNAASLRW